jgi:hypothetical protein
MSTTQHTNGLRIAHIVEWSRSGESCIALIRGQEIIRRFSNWAEAGAAYRKEKAGV